MGREQKPNNVIENTVEVKASEYEALRKFLHFLQTRNYGEFTAVSTVNPKTKTRDVLIRITDSAKLNFEIIVSST